MSHYLSTTHLPSCLMTDCWPSVWLRFRKPLITDSTLQSLIESAQDRVTVCASPSSGATEPASKQLSVHWLIVFPPPSGMLISCLCFSVRHSWLIHSTCQASSCCNLASMTPSQFLPTYAHRRACWSLLAAISATVLYWYVKFAVWCRRSWFSFSQT